MSASTTDIILEPSSYEARPGQRLPFAIRNRGEQTYWVGDDYALERMDSGGWIDVTAEEGFKLFTRTISPGGRFDQWAKIPRRAKPGTYLILKEVFPPGRDRGEIVSCILTVS